MTAVQLIDAHDHEVATLRRAHANKIISGSTERDMLLLAIERNEAIIALITEQTRALRFRAGLPTEIKQHEGEAVIVGEGMS